MICSLPGHAQNLRFSTYEEYEIHYNKTHLNRCLECRKNFPTNHFLNLHIEENHDALAAVRRERGEKTYVCFVEDCDKKCSTPQKRRMHLIDKHYFPKDYDFYIVNNGIDNRSSMLRSGRHRRKSSAAQYAKESKGRQMDVSTGKSSKPENLEAGKQNSSLEDSQESALPATAPSTQGDVYMDDLVGAMSSLKFVPSSVKFGRGGARSGFSKR
ncbi:hypothetical protein B0O99DRAFT_609527 [Bisporella sp. PMI_857]|nr:hypothetical protein B0O99DRAFT_609527 [Bisporella sp. PMI_857]